MGVYTGAVSDAEMRTITVDYTIEFARVLHGSSPEAAFSFLSRNGADQIGKSPMPFARYKGEAENALLAAGLSPCLHISTRVYLPRGAAQGTELQYRLLRATYRVSHALPQPGHSCRPTGEGNGGCRTSGNREACKRGLRKP